MKPREVLLTAVIAMMLAGCQSKFVSGPQLVNKMGQSIRIVSCHKVRDSRCVDELGSSARLRPDQSTNRLPRLPGGGWPWLVVADSGHVLGCWDGTDAGNAIPKYLWLRPGNVQACPRSMG